MRVLVTGGAGFIGSHVVDALVARDDEVVVVDSLVHGRRENVPPQAAVAAPAESAAEPVAEPMDEPVTEQQPAVARGPEFAAPQNRPVHEGRVRWNDEEPAVSLVDCGVIRTRARDPRRSR